MTEIQVAKAGASSSGAQTTVARLFVLELSGDRIHSMNLDGSDRKTIVTDCHFPDGIVVDARPVISIGQAWASRISRRRFDRAGRSRRPES